MACFSARATQVWLAVNHKTSVISISEAHLLHGQESLTAVNQNYVINEVMNGCKNLRIH